MQDKFVLLLVEENKSDNGSYHSESERVPEACPIPIKTVDKNTTSEFLGYPIQRIKFKNIAYPCSAAREFHRLHCVENGSHIEKQGAEDFVDILDILKENVEHGKYHSETDTQKEK